VPDFVMPELSSLAHEVNDIRSQYMAVHNAIFRPSIRKAIPIPGIFKPIRFADHLSTLSRCFGSLRKTQAIIAESHNGKPMPQENQAFLTVLAEYTSALCYTIQSLKATCEKLAEKSAGHGEYSLKTYEKDVQDYQRSARQYMQVGLRLNTAWDQLRGTGAPKVGGCSL